MTKEQARVEGYTHKGLIYRIIPIYYKYFDDFGVDCIGINKFWDAILDIFLFIDQFFDTSDGFYIWEGEEL